MGMLDGLGASPYEKTLLLTNRQDLQSDARSGWTNLLEDGHSLKLPEMISTNSDRRGEENYRFSTSMSLRSKRKSQDLKEVQSTLNDSSGSDLSLEQPHSQDQNQQNEDGWTLTCW